MKLFLASSLNESAVLLPKVLHLDLNGKKVLFSANAADDYKTDKWWVRADREAFIKLGAEVVDIDFRSLSRDDFLAHLKGSFAIHFCGGSVLYLISLLKEKDFVGLLVDAVKKEKIIYSGTSAGSMIVSKDLILSKLDSDEKAYLDRVKDYSGLGLVDFMVIPHTDNASFAESNAEMVKALPEYPQALILLNDKQVAWVQDGKVEIL
ncbi:MAG: Type 1 glutamine amidotransferase-like domain-containing protein [Candidatus Paceibacterota bacterium]|jgi:dipeptidase E